MIPIRVHTILISTQHSPDVTNEQIAKDLQEYVIKPVVPAKYLDKDTIFHLNPSGRFVIGGPHGDAGLTGRKIIIDTYGGKLGFFFLSFPASGSEEAFFLSSLSLSIFPSYSPFSPSLSLSNALSKTNPIDQAGEPTAAAPSRARTLRRLTARPLTTSATSPRTLSPPDSPRSANSRSLTPLESPDPSASTWTPSARASGRTENCRISSSPANSSTSAPP